MKIVEKAKEEVVVPKTHEEQLDEQLAMFTVTNEKANERLQKLVEDQNRIMLKEQQLDVAKKKKSYMVQIASICPDCGDDIETTEKIIPVMFTTHNQKTEPYKLITYKFKLCTFTHEYKSRLEDHR